MNRALRLLTPANVLSWPVVIVSTIWALLMHVTAPNIPATIAPGGRVVAAVAAQAALFAAVWLGSLLVRRLQGAVGGGAMLAIIVAAATLRGVVFDLLLVAVDAVPQGQLGYRVSASVVNMTIGVGLMSVAVGEVRAHRATTAKLLADRARLQELTERAGRSRQQTDERLVGAIQRELLAAVAPMSGGDAASALSALRTAIDDIVRPMSQRLARQDGSAAPAPAPVPRVRLNWRVTLREALRIGRIRPVATTLVGIALMLPTLLAFDGPVVAVLVSGLTFVVGVVALWFVRAVGLRIESRMPRRWWPALFLAALVVGGELIAIPVSVVRAPQPYPNLFLFVDPVFVPLIGAVVAVANTARERAAEVERQLRQADTGLRWSLARAREVERQRRQALADVLHGRVQAALSAACLRIAALSGHGALDETASARIRGDIEAAVAQLGTDLAEPAAFAVMMQRTRATWAGIATIHLVATPEVLDRVAADPVTLQTVVDLIPELCFNAIRHASATWVRIQLDDWSPSGDGVPPDARILRLTVANDGRADTTEAGSGMGTQLLEGASLRWRRFARGDTTVTEATLPLLWRGGPQQGATTPPNGSPLPAAGPGAA